MEKKENISDRKKGMGRWGGGNHWAFSRSSVQHWNCLTDKWQYEYLNKMLIIFSYTTI